MSSLQETGFLTEFYPFPNDYKHLQTSLNS